MRADEVEHSWPLHQALLGAPVITPHISPMVPHTVLSELSPKAILPLLCWEIPDCPLAPASPPQPSTAAPACPPFPAGA